MSIRFSIQNTEPKAQKESDGTIIRFSGTGEPFRRISERSATKIGVDGAGNPRIVFNTGLNEKQVQFFKWYTDEEKAQIKKQLKELRSTIAEYYGGEEVIKEDNIYFWGENRDVNKLSLSHDDIDTFYDTSKPTHALLYLSIISGAFIDLVAPNREWAERHQLPHFLALETDDTIHDDDDITRSDAHAALGELKKDSPEGLFILAWCLQYDTNAFSAYLRSTPQRTLLNYHIQYIDGKLVHKRKKNTAKLFIDAAEKWKASQTRPQLILEAYVKAGEYFNYIQQREKKYVTAEGTELGNTIAEAIETLQKPKYQAEFENLRDRVEAKWKE